MKPEVSLETEIDLNEPLLTDDDLGAFLNTTGKRIKAWRYEGRGPGYIRLGDGPRAPYRTSPRALRRYVMEHSFTN